MDKIINCVGATVVISRGKVRRHLVSVTPTEDIFISLRSVETDYPVDLIEKILEIKGPGWVCEEISRDSNEGPLGTSIFYYTFAYVPEADFAGKRLLDFGSGSGASSMILGRLLPESSIIGVELEQAHIDIANRRAEFHGLTDRVRFLTSPSGDSLPEGIGDFDYIFLNAVFEHLLPEERTRIIPMLWSRLKPGGVLFLNQTPHRWSPIDSHTTGLPLVNYLPPALARLAANRLSRRGLAGDDWPTLLRKGIRGTSRGEIGEILASNSYAHTFLAPSQHGVSDEVDLWLKASTLRAGSPVRRLFTRASRLQLQLTGSCFVPYLSLAVRKDQV